MTAMTTVQLIKAAPLSDGRPENICNKKTRALSSVEAARVSVLRDRFSKSRFCAEKKSDLKQDKKQQLSESEPGLFSTRCISGLRQVNNLYRLRINSKQTAKRMIHVVAHVRIQDFPEDGGGGLCTPEISNLTLEGD